MKIRNVVWTLIAMAHSVHDLNCDNASLEDDSASDGFGPQANELPVTATSTWDVLPSVDYIEHSNNLQSVPSSSNSTSMNNIAQTSDRWLSLVRESNFSVPSRVNFGNAVNGWEHTLFSALDI